MSTNLEEPEEKEEEIDDDVIVLADAPAGETIIEREAAEIRLLLEEEVQLARSQPDVSELQDAVVDGAFTVPVGGRLIIERFTNIGDRRRWLDTHEYEVRKINEETGDLHLWNTEQRHMAMSNFRSGPARGYRFKLPARGFKTTRRRLTKLEKKLLRPVEGPSAASKKKESSGERRVYLVRGVVCTRLKGVAYVAAAGTKAIPGSRVTVSSPQNHAVVVTHTDGWTESWEERPGM